VSLSLLERVRKLLAQAEDSGVTAAEADAFNAKAAELIARHGIDAAHLAASGQTTDEIADRRIVMDQPYARDKAQLLTSVAHPLRCHTVHHHGRDGFWVRIYGYGSDLERVELLYTSLLMQATRELVHIRPEYAWGESTAAYRRSWLAGYASAVYTRLLRAEEKATAQTPTSTSGTSTALVLQDRTAQVDAAVRADYPRLRSMRTRSLSGSGRSDGIRSGYQADLGARRLNHTHALPR
jgi:hypothetical protein